MDEACTIIEELMALVGIGDKGWTDAEQWRLENVAEQARAYLAQHTSEENLSD
jgi:GAF domain-containing protein